MSLLQEQRLVGLALDSAKIPSLDLDSAEPNRTRFECRPLLTATTVVLGFCIADALLTLACAIASSPDWTRGGAEGGLRGYLVTLIVVLLVGGMACERGLYSRAVVLSPQPPLWRAMLAWLQACGALLILLASSALVPHLVVNPPARSFLATLAALQLAGLLGLRLIWHCAILPRCRGNLAANRIVVVGATRCGEEVIRRARAEPGGRWSVVGVFHAGAEAGKSFCGVPLIGDLEQMIDGIGAKLIDTIIVAHCWPAAPDARSVVERLAMAPVDIRLAPGLDAFSFPERPVSSLAGLPLLEIRNRPLSERSARLKRVEDLVIASAALVLVAPLMLLIAIAIKADTPGPVLFRQRRYGLNGSVFTLMKFRTMHVDHTDHDARRQTARGDRRVTRVGSYLRRHSLDELPQVLNVLAGDMSVVGPRPHALSTSAGGVHLRDAVWTYISRYRVKPGITGWAQVNGCRGEIDSMRKISRRIEHDLFYIDNWSLLLDMKILVKTAAAILRDTNAY